MEQVQEETLTMLMGKMMALIQGRRVADDDEHTEVSTLRTSEVEHKANESPVRYI